MKKETVAPNRQKMRPTDYTHPLGTVYTIDNIKGYVKKGGYWYSFKMNQIKYSYPNCECPDCGEPIPDNVVDGQTCTNCEHVFREKKEDNNDFEIGAYLNESREECIKNKNHFKSCDNDGFCNFCGNQ